MHGNKLGRLFRLMVAGVVALMRLHQTGAVTLRLRDGAYGEGRVEVFYGGVWGSVCDDGWTDQDSQVVCRQLNWSGGERFPERVPGSGSILMDDVLCGGSELNLEYCVFAGWGEHNCHHGEDVGVRCTNTSDVRLVDGAWVNEGRVEIFHDGLWGTVCDNGWGVYDATVVCKQLGYVFGDARVGGDFIPGSGPIWLGGVACDGTESSLASCVHSGWNKTVCDHIEDAGVICGASLPNVRLVNGTTASEGRVEVFHGGEWGTVCDNNWDDNDAHVVCYALGYHCGLGRNDFPEGTGPIHLDYMSCTGQEAHLVYCNHAPIGVNVCPHSQDSGVECSSTACNSAPNVLNAQKAVTGRTVTYTCSQGYFFPTGMRTMTFECWCSGDWSAVSGHTCSSLTFPLAPYAIQPDEPAYSQAPLFDGNPLTCTNLRTRSCRAPQFRIMIPWFTGRASYPTTFYVKVHYGSIFVGLDNTLFVWTSIDGIHDGKNSESRVLNECPIDANLSMVNSFSTVFSCGCANWCDVHVWALLSPSVYSSSGLGVNLCEIELV